MNQVSGLIFFPFLQSLPIHQILFVPCLFMSVWNFYFLSISLFLFSLSTSSSVSSLHSTSTSSNITTFSSSSSSSFFSSVEVQRSAFASLAHVIKTVHNLHLHVPTDKHGRNIILSSYVQFVFSAPEGPSNAAGFDVRHSTASRSRGSFHSDNDVSRRSSTSRQPVVTKSSKCVLFLLLSLFKV